MYKRIIEQQIEKWIDKREVLIVFGARQVGKTTSLKQILSKFNNSILLNCELPLVSNILESKNLSSIKTLFSDKKIIGLDEAQKIDGIGEILKLIYDELPQYKLIATGSSSFDLANKTGEPLTGRNIKFLMFPLSISEVKDTKDWLWVLENLNNFLILGLYPGIIDLEPDEKKTKLGILSSDYLYKDILVQSSIESPSNIRKLLTALAFQVGSQVSVNELSNNLQISRANIQMYLDLLEKAFIIFNLGSYSSNLRNEIKKSRKYYFYDNGILNSLISDYRPVELRNDIGMLWENFCISERFQFIRYYHPFTRMYFWRTYDGAEIDLIEEHNGELAAFEFKWNIKRKVRLPESFANKYNVKDFKIITPENIYELISG